MLEAETSLKMFYSRFLYTQIEYVARWEILRKFLFSFLLVKAIYRYIKHYLFWKPHYDSFTVLAKILLFKKVEVLRFEHDQWRVKGPDCTSKGRQCCLVKWWDNSSVCVNKTICADLRLLSTNRSFNQGGLKSVNRTNLAAIRTGRLSGCWTSSYHEKKIGAGNSYRIKSRTSTSSTTLTIIDFSKRVVLVNS